MTGRAKPIPTGPAPAPGTVPAHRPVAQPPINAPVKNLTHDQQSAFDLMNATLASWGLNDLAADVRKLVVGGDTDQSTLALALSQTDAYKQRFAANEARRKAGLRELLPAEYLAVEEGYRNLANQYGLPAGYLNKETTDKMIAGGVNVPEAQQRIQAAADVVWNSPPEAQKAWDQFYGGGPGGVIATMLDPTKAAPLVEQQAMAAQIGGAALSQGLTADRSNSERYAQEGLTLSGARKAYGDIASRLSTDTSVAARFGTTFGQSQEEQATIEGSAPASQKQNSLYAQEASLFGGHGGGTTQTGNPGANY